MYKTLELINKKLNSTFTTISSDGKWNGYDVYECWYGYDDASDKDIGYPVAVIVKGDIVKRADVKAIMKDKYGIQ